MMPVRSEVALASATISYLDWQPSQERGSPVVLLHGGGADSAELSWGALGPALAAAGHRVIAPDHPGFGQSPRADWPLTQERLLQYVAEFVDTIGVTDYVVAGLSLGGGLTIGHLLARPGRARGAVLLGTYGVMPRLADGSGGAIVHAAAFAMLRTGILTRLSASAARHRRTMERGLRDIIRDPAARTPELVEAVIAEAATGSGMAVFGEWQRDQVRWNGLRTDYTAQLASIRTPTLLIHGERDGGVPVSRVRAAAARLPHSTLVVVPGAGHWVQRDRPDVATRAILDHLRRIDDAPSARP
ncbi:MAG: alpha/beta hydrolase [Candidatus Microbacterium colombiense]|nr:MAG: alpha/beta hydrolase [Microbacterium sp.]